MFGRNKVEPIQISERELLAMTADLDEMHHASLPALREAVAEFGGMVPSRRTFLMGTGAMAGGVALAACSKKTKSGSSSSTTSGGAVDLKVGALAAALENTAVATYAAGIAAATAGKLGAVPPAVVTFATTAQAQHKDHAAAWNAILTGNKLAAVTGVDKTVNDAVVQPTFAKVTDVVGLAKLALELENVAAATYLSTFPILTIQKAIQTAASIQPVEMQHVAILNFVLGQYPVPDTFAKIDGARPATDVIA